MRTQHHRPRTRRRWATFAATTVAAASLTVAGQPSADAALSTTGDIILGTEGHFFDGGAGLDRLDHSTNERARLTTFGIGAGTSDVITMSDGSLVAIVGGQAKRVNLTTGAQTALKNNNPGLSISEASALLGNKLAILGTLSSGRVLGILDPATGSFTPVSTAALLDGAFDVAGTFDGHLLVTANGGLWKFAPDGKVTQLANFAALARGLAIDSQGIAYVHVDAGGTAGVRIYAVDEAGDSVTVAAEGGSLTKQNFGMAVDSQGRVITLERIPGTIDVVRVNPTTHAQQKLITVGDGEATDVAVAGVSGVGGFVPPTAVDDTLTVDSAWPEQRGEVLTNDNDSKGHALHATYGQPSHGFISAFPDGHYIYFGNADYVGPDSFTYQAVTDDGRTSKPATVHITVTPPDAPTAHDDEFTIESGHTLSIDRPGVLANDTDPNESTGDFLRAQADGPFKHGTGSLLSLGGLTYTPEPGFTGDEQITYRAYDQDSTPSQGARIIIHVVPSTSTAPSIDLGTGPGLTAGTDGRSGSFPLVLGDGEDAADALAVETATSRPKLVRDISVTGTGADRRVTIRVARRGHGTALVGVQVTDSSGLTDAVLIRVVVGGDGADKLVGTAGPDLVIGRGGNDVILGRGARDVLTAGAGNDVLDGGKNRDFLRGGAGKDRVKHAEQGDVRKQM